MKKKIVIVLLILCMLDIVYLTSFKVNGFNTKFYSSEFSKYDVYSDFPSKDIDKMNSEILDYLRYNGEYDKELFNEEEITHFEDVRLLILKLNIYFYSLLVVFVFLLVLLYVLDKKKFLRNLALMLFFSGLSILIVTIALLILSVFNFDGLFIVFHKMFFPQGGYSFSASSNIIKLYPASLFYDIAKNIFLNIIYYGNLLIGVGVLLILKND
jgi:integral membrane protein (TIGR01906 family)